MKSFLNFWTSLPGVLTGLAAVLTAIAGLYTAGVFKDKKVEPKPTPTVTTSPKSVARTPEIETTPEISIPESTPTPKIEITSEKPTTTPTPTSKIIETDFFKFKLQKCQRTRETVDCSFLITNLTDDFRTIYLYAYDDDRVADSSGNTYNFTKVEIANLYANNGYRVRTPLSPGLPIKANIYLKLPTDINKLAGLEFSYASGNRNRKKLLLRNIPIVTTPEILTPTPRTILESTAEYIKRFRKGQIAFNTPEKMLVGDNTEIEVKITDDLQRELEIKTNIEQTIERDDLQRELEIKTNIGQTIERDEIDISHIMTAELTGLGFDIKPLQKDNTFLVLPSRVVSWRWEITPLKSGKQKLYLRINAKLRLDDFETAYTLQNFERIIEVQVNPGKWFQSNWFKVIEIFLVIFGSGIVGFIVSKITVIKKIAEKINNWIQTITKKINSWIKNIYKKLK